MAFVEDVKKYVDKGITASKDAFSKAGSAAERFGGQGVKRVELLQLSSQLTQNYAKLGEAVFDAVEASPEATVSARADGIAPLVEKIARLKKDIAERESALKNS